MYKVRITAVRQTVYPDLMDKYENRLTSKFLFLGGTIIATANDDTIVLLKNVTALLEIATAQFGYV